MDPSRSSIEGSIALATLLWGFSIHMLFFTARSFRLTLPDRWSTLTGNAALAALGAVVLADGGRIIPTPFNWLLVAVGILASYLAVIFVVLKLQTKIDQANHFFRRSVELGIKQSVPEELQQRIFALFDPKPVDKELRRKGPHLMMFFLVPLLLGGGALIVRGISYLIGLNPPESELASELGQEISSQAQLGLIAGSLAPTLTIILIMCLGVASNEFVRLRFPESNFAFRDLILGTARESESQNFGAHFYLLLASGFALWLLGATLEAERAVRIFAAILLVTILSDSASALIGRRYGKTKWFHNSGKSYLGTFAGVAVAVIGCWPLVGGTLSILFALGYLAIDAVAPKPIHISDNLLIPICLSLLALI